MYLALEMKQSWLIAFILEWVITIAGLDLMKQQLCVQVNNLVSVCVCTLSLLYCSDTPCVDGEVLLVGGHNVQEGRVLFCYNGEWYSICSDSWSEMDAEADVVCSTLGYSAQLGQKC